MRGDAYIIRLMSVDISPFFGKSIRISVKKLRQFKKVCIFVCTNK